MVLLRTLAGMGLIGLCTTVSAATVEKFANGDFNGDGKRDVAVISNDGGFSTIDVYLSPEAASLNKPADGPLNKVSIGLLRNGYQVTSMATAKTIWL